LDGVVARPTRDASSASLGSTSGSPSGVITTGSDNPSAWAASSSRSPSGSSELYQRYGTWLRARNSRTSEHRADQRCPTTLISGTGR
jgi:hypothetical protein